MPLTLKIINQLEMAKTPVAIETVPSSSELRSWVAVYPKQPEKGLDYFELRSFEIRKELVDEYFGQEEVQNSRSQKVATIDEVEQVLQEWGVASEDLQVSWNCDYPL